MREYSPVLAASWVVLGRRAAEEKPPSAKKTPPQAYTPLPHPFKGKLLNSGFPTPGSRVAAVQGQPSAFKTHLPTASPGQMQPRHYAPGSQHFRPRPHRRPPSPAGWAEEEQPLGPPSPSPSVRVRGIWAGASPTQRSCSRHENQFVRRHSSRRMELLTKPRVCR